MVVLSKWAAFKILEDYMEALAEHFLTKAFQQYLQRDLTTISNQGLHMQKDTGRGSQPTAALLPLRPRGKQDSGIPLAPHATTVHPRAPDHVFRPDPEISPRTRAAWEKHPDWATLSS